MMEMDELLSNDEVGEARARRLLATHLQAIEDSAPTPEQTAMFEMFEREGWSHQRRLAYIRARVQSAGAIHAAE